MNKLDYIRNTLGEPELLCQLAEEAAELSKAALKLRRVYDGTNPTPVSEGDALSNLKEEIADIWLVLNALGLCQHIREYDAIMQFKTKRWAGRLKESEVKHGCST